MLLVFVRIAMPRKILQVFRTPFNKNNKKKINHFNIPPTHTYEAMTTNQFIKNLTLLHSE